MFDYSDINILPDAEDHDPCLVVTFEFHYNLDEKWGRKGSMKARHKTLDMNCCAPDLRILFSVVENHEVSHSPAVGLVC